MANYKNLMEYIQIEGVDVDLLQGLSDLEADKSTIPNLAVINYAHKMGYLYGDNEVNFLQNILKWQVLRDAQEQWLRFINRRIRKGIVVQLNYDEWFFD